MRKTLDGVTVWSGGPVPKGSSGITFGNLIIVRAKAKDSRYLLAHERVHVEQYRAFGPLGFMVRYLGDYLRWRLRGHSHRAAYLRIGFEIEADWLARRHQPSLLAKMGDPSLN